MLNYCLVAGLSYLIGSIPFGYLFAWKLGVDLRAVGSGNIGATNVARALGRRVGIVVFFLDALKGALPAGIALWWFGIEEGALAAVAALVGHMLPIWLRFRGGKGVATGAGALAILIPLPVILGFVLWCAVFATWRIVSLASLSGAALMTVVALLQAMAATDSETNKKAVVAAGAFVLVAIRHRGNIRRLYEGTENRFVESTSMLHLSKVIHVLAVALWWGSNVFFSLIAAVLIFRTWEGYAQDPPIWFPGAASFTKETGTRIAGATVGPIFPFFFAVQAMCALLALVTSLGFIRWEPERRVHRTRFALIALAALTVAIGWPISLKVSALREQRYANDPAQAAFARSQFGPWHTVSLFLNFGTIGLTTAATALAASLPGHSGSSRET
jgi:acyl-phosphate glycerol 3-phosphate acyltransferase